MTNHETMIIQARTFYSEWKRNKPFSLLQFRVVLNYFERKHHVGETFEITGNVFSKMKLLYNLAIE